MIKLIELIKLMPSRGKIQVLDNTTWEDYIYSERDEIICGYNSNGTFRNGLDSFIPVRVYGNSIYVYKTTLGDETKKKDEKFGGMQVEIIYTNGSKAIIDNVIKVKIGSASDLLFAHEILEYKLLPSSVVAFIQKGNNEPSEIINLKYINIITTKIGQQ